MLGNTEVVDDGAKQYEAMYSSCEPSNSSSVEESAANGMVLTPEDLGYQLYEVPGKHLAYTVTASVLKIPQVLYVFVLAGQVMLCSLDL